MSEASPLPRLLQRPQHVLLPTNRTQIPCPRRKGKLCEAEWNPSHPTTAKLSTNNEWVKWTTENETKNDFSRLKRSEVQQRRKSGGKKDEKEKEKEKNRGGGNRKVNYLKSAIQGARGKAIMPGIAVAFWVHPLHNRNRGGVWGESLRDNGSFLHPQVPNSNFVVGVSR